MPKTKSTSQSKQGRLSFPNQKRTGSASKATPKGKSPATIKRAPKKEQIESVESSESSDDDQVEIIESDGAGAGQTISHEDIDSDDSVEAPPPPKKVHAEGETPEHQILREFDLTYEYGPCIGMSRIERWERADRMGLNPPQKVYGILQQHDTADYLQCCFARHGRF
ncbi:hypothetical protein BDZ89DRAFT_1162140 [Hymenopellis radicata]|nr:hypothetical protein BDZ89DRAFT_1162140 [Hymenopellis radicata]